MIARELTRMRYSPRLEDVEAALSKALVLTIDGFSEIIKYEAVKKPPKNYFDLRKDVEEDEETKDEEQLELEELKKENKLLKNALLRLLDEFSIPTKVDKSKYLRIRTKNNKWKSLGPIAPYLKSS